MDDLENQDNLDIWEKLEEVTIEEKHDSQEFAIRYPRKILLVNPASLGVHEGIKEEKLKELDFSAGWYGSPIAVVTLNQNLVLPLDPGIYKYQNCPELAFGVLDGHHRVFEAMMHSGIYVPIQVFPADSLHIETWNREGSPFTLNQVVNVLLDPEKLLPPRATRFKVSTLEGNRLRLSNFQPRVRFNKDILAI